MAEITRKLFIKYIKETNELLADIVERILTKRQEELLKLIKEKAIQGEPGEPGSTPKRGRDFLTPKEMEAIKKELRPKKGRDFFDGEPGEPGKNPSLRELQRLIAKAVPKNEPVDLVKIAKEMARAFEKLPDEEKLDYFSLKNIPNIPTTPPRKRGKFKLRGGGGGEILLSKKVKATGKIENDSRVTLVDATDGAITLTLPNVEGAQNKEYHIKKVDSSANAVTIATLQSETIDDGTTAVIANQYESIRLYSDSQNWHVI